MKKITKFFAGVILETKRVQWPKGKDLLKLSVATISFMTFNAIFFYVVVALMLQLKVVVGG
jgi:preprotein translocase SecE subunit